MERMRPLVNLFSPEYADLYALARKRDRAAGRMSHCMRPRGRIRSEAVIVPVPTARIHMRKAPAKTAGWFLRRHKLPTPHLALWPTEVHVVMRGKVCEKGGYFLGIQTPLVATCKNKVCISNICHYLHFRKHTDFQNKDIQSPKYSVVLHLDHCIPVRP